MRASRTAVAVLFALATVACSGAANNADTSAGASTGASSAAMPMEGTRQVASGGINAAGWTGGIDPKEAEDGQRP